MTYRFDRFTEREAKRLLDDERDNAERAERQRLASRSLWHRIADLSESDELKEILWALIPEEEQ